MQTNESISFEFDSGRVPKQLRYGSITIPSVLDGVELKTALESAEYVDCITYTYTPFASVKFRRAIVGNGRGPANAILVRGTHAKMYITYDKRDCPTAYIGSMNAVSPTLFELVVQLNTKQSIAAAEYFEELWRLNNPNYAKCPTKKISR